MTKTGFANFDKVAGGLATGQPHLFYGDSQTAVSVFALTCLAEGISQGETVALVTRSNPDSILAEARRYGCEFGDSLKSGRFLIFQYPEDISERSRNLMDDLQIIQEFRRLVHGHDVRRLVVHPVTPLLSNQSLMAAAGRFQTIVSAFADLGATAIYTVDSTKDAELAAICRDSSAGILLFEQRPSGSARILIERWPLEVYGSSIDVAIVDGIGLTTPLWQQNTAPAPRVSLKTATPVAAVEQTAAVPVITPIQTQALGRPKILIVHPDRAQRVAINEALSNRYEVLEAQGAADGVATIGSGRPDIVVLANETRGASGIAIARKLRESGHNMPIILTGNRIRRQGDQATALGVGIDVCLDYPINARILGLHIENMLRRIGRLHGVLEDFGSSEPHRTNVNCTTDLEYFCKRAAEEHTYSLEQGLNVPLLTLRMSSGRPMVEDIAAAATLFSRANDLIYLGERGVAVLLVDATSADPFLTRFMKAWKNGTPPMIEHARDIGETNAVERIRAFVLATAALGWRAVTDVTDASLEAPGTDLTRQISRAIAGNSTSL